MTLRFHEVSNFVIT